MLFTHVGQMNSSVEDLLRLPIKSKINQKYVYPIQIDMQITCPPQSDLALIKKANKLINGEGRLLVRKSGTEPVIRIMCEPENQAILSKCVNIVKKSFK